ncbi:MAG: hypothetical protein P1U40_08420 [Coxiellaceae bacterium]|nr:hypothetical protein [Coxiellaceae bacterium]
MSRKKARTEAPGIDPAGIFCDTNTHQDSLYSYLGVVDSTRLSRCSRFWRASYSAAEAERPPGELLLDCLSLLRDKDGNFKAVESSLAVRKKILQVFEKWRQAVGIGVDGWRGKFDFDDLYFLFYQVSNDCGVEKASLMPLKDVHGYEQQLKRHVGTLGQLSLWAKARKLVYVCQLISACMSRRTVFGSRLSLTGIEDLACYVPGWRDAGELAAAAREYATQLLTSIVTLLSLGVDAPQATAILEQIASMGDSQVQILSELFSSPDVFNCFFSKGNLAQIFSLGLRKVQMIRQNPEIQAWDMVAWQAFPLRVFDVKMPLTDKPIMHAQAQQVIRNQVAILAAVKRQLPDGGGRHELALESWYGIDPADPQLPLLRSYHAFTSHLASHCEFFSGPLVVFLLATWTDPKALLQIPESVLTDRKRWVDGVTTNRRKAQYQILQENPNDWRLLCDQARFDALVAGRYAALPIEEERSLEPARSVVDLPVFRFGAGLKPPTRTLEDELDDLRMSLRF